MFADADAPLLVAFAAWRGAVRRAAPRDLRGLEVEVREAGVLPKECAHKCALNEHVTNEAGIGRGEMLT